MKKLHRKERLNINSVEKMLTNLPKKCNCSLCTTTKNFAKTELGESRYNTFSKEIDLL